MPCYLYQHPEKDMIVEVVQSMFEVHEFVDDDGVQWRRIYTIPNFAMDSQKGDPYNEKDYLRSLDKKCTVGEMLDLSAELSEERKEKDGEDPIKKKYFKKYEEKNKVKHIADKPEKIDTKHYSIDFKK